MKKQNFSKKESQTWGYLKVCILSIGVSLLLTACGSSYAPGTQYGLFPSLNGVPSSHTPNQKYLSSENSQILADLNSSNKNEIIYTVRGSETYISPKPIKTDTIIKLVIGKITPAAGIGYIGDHPDITCVSHRISLVTPDLNEDGTIKKDQNDKTIYKIIDQTDLGLIQVTTNENDFSNTASRCPNAPIGRYYNPSSRILNGTSQPVYIAISNTKTDHKCGADFQMAWNRYNPYYPYQCRMGKNYKTHVISGKIVVKTNELP